MENGVYYEGMIKDNQRHGDGKMVYPSLKTKGEERKFYDSTYFEGQFENNKRSGQGRELLSDGTFKEGLWVDNEYKQEVQIDSSNKKSNPARKKVVPGLCLCPNCIKINS